MSMLPLIKEPFLSTTSSKYATRSRELDSAALTSLLLGRASAVLRGISLHFCAEVHFGSLPIHMLSPLVQSVSVIR